MLIISVFLCAGTIYAHVDATAPLSNWYTDTFQKEDEKIGSTAESEVWIAFKQLETFLIGARGKTDSTIEDTQNKLVEKVKAGIDEEVTHINYQLNMSVTELEKENFDDYVKNRAIEEDIEQEVAAILAEILSE